MSAVALQSFGFGDQLVRVMDRNAGVWFVANDVCGALEINNPRDAISKLDEDEKGVVTTDTLGGRQQVSIISESGVYSLIFKSRKPSAVAFRKWVTGQVLPTIRQTGKYEAVPVEEPANDEADAMDSVERIRAALQVVREARITFGNKAARRAWVLTGLPDVTSEAQGTSTLSYMDEKAQAVARWFAERVEMTANTRENATALYMDFSRYCDDANEEAVTIKRFGRIMTELGIEKIHSNGCYYIGVRLKP
jgi:prophage antirepressor-like protein